MFLMLLLPDATVLASLVIVLGAAIVWVKFCSRCSAGVNGRCWSDIADAVCIMLLTLGGGGPCPPAPPHPCVIVGVKLCMPCIQCSLRVEVHVPHQCVIVGVKLCMPCASSVHFGRRSVSACVQKLVPLVGTLTLTSGNPAPHTQV